MKNIKHLLVKDIIRFLNDKTALLLTFLVPAILIFIFGNIFGGGNGRSKVPVILVNKSQSKLSKIFEEKLDSSSSIYLIRYYTDEGDTVRKKYTEEVAEEKIKAGARSAAVIFPEDFYTDTSNSVKIKFLFDPKDEISAGIIQGSIQQAVMSSIPDVFPEIMNRMLESRIGKDGVELFESDMTNTISKHFNVPIEELANPKDSSSIFNPPGAKAADFMNKLIRIENKQLVGKEIKNPNVTRIVGGWAIMFLLFTITSTASSLIEEKQDGTLKRLLCMPVNRSDILWSKYIFSIIIGIVQLSVLFILACLMFDVDIFSNFFNLCIVILASAAAAVSFGMLITATSSTMQQANGVATLIIMVMSALGGSWFPIFLFPEWMQTLSKLTLTYWSVEAFQQVLWRQGDLASISINLIVLISIAIIVNFYAIMLFKRGKIF